MKRRSSTDAANATDEESAPSLSERERAALLKCRHAGRYDSLGSKKTRTRATEAEAAEEQWAWRQDIPPETFARLASRGFIARERGVFRLSPAGARVLALSSPSGAADPAKRPSHR